MAATYLFIWQPLRAMMLGFRWHYLRSLTLDDMPFSATAKECFAPWEFSLHIGLPFLSIIITFEGHNPYA